MKKMVFCGLALLALLLAACSDTTNAPVTTDVLGGGITLRGSITIGGTSGAFPATFVASHGTSARSATSSFSDSLTWTIEAQDADTKKPLATSGTVNEDMTFTLSLPQKGTYMLVAEALNAEEDSVLYGNTEITVEETGASSVVISVKPNQGDTTGKISLAITDESGKVANVTVYEYATTDTETTATEFATAAFTDGKASITKESVSAGTHQVKLVFEDETGNTLYSCREAVTVFSGFTTDTWYGSAPYFTTANGNTNFVLTEDLITTFGTEIVPNTQMMLWNSAKNEDEGTTEYTYYLTDDAGMEITDDTLDNVTSSTNSFCFDNDGNMYILTEKGEKLSSTKKGVSDITLSTSLNSNGYGDYGIMIDRTENVLYGYSIQEASLTVYKYPTLISGGTESSDSTVSYTCSARVTIGDETNSAFAERCAVNNGIVYTLCYLSVGDKNQYYLAIFDLASATDEGKIEVESPVLLNLGDIGGDNLQFTDMLYQDGAVYLLVRDYKDDISQTYNMSELAYYSRGAVIKYDTIFGTVQTLGWTKDDSVASTAGIYAYYKDTNKATDPYEYYYTVKTGEGTDATYSEPLLIPAGFTFELSADFPKLYLPSGANSTAGFYGPEKFIAVKPKKLVIADDGVAFYTDANGAYNIKNVNRVVTVDLETFAITDAKDTNVAFDDTTESSIFSASAFTNINNVGLSEDVSLYLENGSSFESGSYESVYIGIPLSE